MFIERQILKTIERSLKQYPVTLVTGARQVGKTTLVTELEKKYGYTYLTFDDTDMLRSAKADPKKFVEMHPSPVIYDEVQRAPELFVEIEAAVNKKRRLEGSLKANGMFILTGSQKYSLMQGVTESLSGRVSVIEMPPLSQTEIRDWENNAFQIENQALMASSEERVLSEDDFYESIVRGFYPARWENEGMPIENYYYNYVQTYVERDVSQLINLKDKAKFENLLKMLASLTGEEFVPDNVAKAIGVDKNTVDRWVSIVVAGGLVTLLSPYYETSIRKRIVKRKKLYFNDTGLACYLLGIDSPKALVLSAFKGRIVETYIHNEIRKSFVNNGIPAESSMFYYRDNNQNEIDLVLVREGELNLVECKAGRNYSIDAIKGFDQLRQTNYEIKGKCLICLSPEPYRIEAGVYAFPIRCL